MRNFEEVFPIDSNIECYIAHQTLVNLELAIANKYDTSQIMTTIAFDYVIRIFPASLLDNSITIISINGCRYWLSYKLYTKIFMCSRRRQRVFFNEDNQQENIGLVIMISNSPVYLDNVSDIVTEIIEKKWSRPIGIMNELQQIEYIGSFEDLLK